MTSTTLAALSWAAPAMLGGALLIALPIVAHLLNQRTRRRVVFPSLVLLASSKASQSQLFRLRRLLLLLLRCLAVLLLVAAFAQPLWVASPAQSAAQADGASVAIVVDTSASTSQQVGGVSAMQSLRAAAGRSLDDLQAGADRANLILADHRPRAILPTMTASHDALRREVERITPTHERADMAGALALAAGQLREQAGPHHLVIISDMQQTNWNLNQLSRANITLPAGTRITLVPLRGERPDNLALTTGRVTPRLPRLDQATTASVTVTNFANTERTIDVTLRVDDEVRQSRGVTVAPWQQRDVQFNVRFQQPGTHRITFALPDDAMDADNQHHVVTRAVQRIPMTVIGDDAPDQPGTSTYFLMRALSPRGDQRDKYRVHHVASAEADWADLHDAAAVLISDTGELPQTLASALGRYIEQGGGVAMFAGSGPVPSNLRRIAQNMETDNLAPWLPAQRRDLAQRGDVISLGEAKWNAPLLAPFDDEARAALQRIHFKRIWMGNEARDSTDVLMRFTDGTPALGRQSVGDGQMLVAAFSPALADSDLGKHGAFVALMQRMVESLRPDSSAFQPVGTVGKSITVALPGDMRDVEAPLRVLTPGGEPISESQLAVGESRSQIVIDRPAQIGFYDVRLGDAPAAVGAANIDKRESDLRRIDAQALQQQLSTALGDARIADASLNRGVLDLRGSPLWGWFALAALGALALELVLLCVWAR